MTVSESSVELGTEAGTDAIEEMEEAIARTETTNQVQKSLAQLLGIIIKHFLF